MENKSVKPKTTWKTNNKNSQPELDQKFSQEKLAPDRFQFHNSVQISITEDYLQSSLANIITDFSEKLVNFLLCSN